MTSNADTVRKSIMEALGGKENIVEIDNCISRLRLVLQDTSVINENGLKKTGSLGIISVIPVKKLVRPAAKSTPFTFFLFFGNAVWYIA